jgi:hypothetical protein
MRADRSMPDLRTLRTSVLLQEAKAALIDFVTAAL